MNAFSQSPRYRVLDRHPAAMSESADSLGVARDNLEEQNTPEKNAVGVLDETEESGNAASNEAVEEESQNTDTTELQDPAAGVSFDEKETADQSSSKEQSDVIVAEENHNGKNAQDEPNEEGEATTTVQFIAVSAEEHQRMVTSGELPESVQGADVHMQIPGAEAQQVRLIAVDSNGVPVTETAILQAAAEQAGIVFITKDDDDNDVQITIDEAMKLSEGGSGARHIITATTAAALLEQQNKPAKSSAKPSFKDVDAIDSEDEGDEKATKPSLQIRVYSQKDSQQIDEANFESTELSTTATTTALVTMDDLANTSAIIAPAAIELADESVYEFQEPPTGKDSEEGITKIAIIDSNMFKKSGPRRVVDKTRVGRKIYQCKECAFYSHRHSNLIRHIKIHTDERPYQCHLCERAFRTNTLLRNHINTHTGVKPYKCAEPDCDMAFVTSGELTRHIRYRHTHEKPFKCTLCDYASVEISKLRRHFRSHTGERPYSCDDCGKAFADSFHLKRHRMSHTGEKPYECPECNQRFTQRGSVKMHIMQQHLKNAPKFACEICHTLLGRKSDLNVHMRKQHAYQETPIQCRYCGELFHDRWNLMKHQKTHRSYGSRQTPNGKERRKRPWEGDDDADYVGNEEVGVSGSKIPMIMEGQNQVTVYVENDIDDMYEEDDEPSASVDEDNQTENEDVTLVSVPAIAENNLASVMLSGENEPVLLMRPESDQALIVSTEQSSTIATSVTGSQVTAVISDSGEIVHLVDSSIMQSLDQEHSQEEKDASVKTEELDEDETKLEIADGEDDLIGSSLSTTE